MLAIPVCFDTALGMLETGFRVTAGRSLWTYGLWLRWRGLKHRHHRLDPRELTVGCVLVNCSSACHLQCKLSWNTSATSQFPVDRV